MLLRLISLLLLPIAVSSLGFGGCGCGLQLPPICLPSLPPLFGCGSTCGCGRKKREAIKPQIVGSDDRQCNNDHLKQIISNGIKSNQTLAKSIIHSEARAKLGGNWVVVCAPEPVSFVTQSQQFCLDGHDGTWCYAFQLTD
uniref:Ground region domain containing protein n=1 Tax=Haemonchus contortus TaxID=6289 RepID=A0A7I4YNB2_HAECO